MVSIDLKVVVEPFSTSQNLNHSSHDVCNLVITLEEG